MTTTYKELRWSLKFDFRCFDDVPSSNILKQSKSRMILYCFVSLLIQDPRQYLQRVSWMVAPPWVSFLPSSLWSATLLNQPTDGDDYSQSLRVDSGHGCFTVLQVIWPTILKASSSSWWESWQNDIVFTWHIRRFPASKSLIGFIGLVECKNLNQ